MRVGGRERKRKDNAEALRALRFAEEEGLTTEDTEGTEKWNAGSKKLGRLR